MTITVRPSPELESNVRLVAACALVITWKMAGPGWAVAALLLSAVVGAAEGVIRAMREHKAAI